MHSTDSYKGIRWYLTEHLREQSLPRHSLMSFEGHSLPHWLTYPQQLLPKPWTNDIQSTGTLLALDTAGKSHLTYILLTAMPPPPLFDLWTKNTTDNDAKLFAFWRHRQGQQPKKWQPPCHKGPCINFDTCGHPFPLTFIYMPCILEQSCIMDYGTVSFVHRVGLLGHALCYYWYTQHFSNQTIFSYQHTTLIFSRKPGLISIFCIHLTP